VVESIREIFHVGRLIITLLVLIFGLELMTSLRVTSSVKIDVLGKNIASFNDIIGESNFTHQWIFDTDRHYYIKYCKKCILAFLWGCPRQNQKLWYFRLSKQFQKF